MFVTFLSDFGLSDDFVGICHGVIKRIAPDAELLDITHGIPAQGVIQGAIVLANAIGYVPEGVHLAVVDPGVGTERRGLALRDRQGRLYVGPDNGLLVPAAERMGGIDAAHELAEPAYWLDNVSATFHGRDIFAPVAAHLASGVDLAELGPPLDAAEVVRPNLPEPEIGRARIRATILYVDRFGNVQLNLGREHLERVGLEPGKRVELELPLERYYAVSARTFADARRGDLILYEDSYGNIAIALRGGDAATMLSARPGDEVRIGPAPE
jgi:S-adenosyl-L-methionine hydrolase (adenosine-forming)